MGFSFLSNKTIAPRSHLFETHPNHIDQAWRQERAQDKRIDQTRRRCSSSRREHVQRCQRTVQVFPLRPNIPNKDGDVEPHEVPSQVQQHPNPSRCSLQPLRRDGEESSCWEAPVPETSAIVRPVPVPVPVPAPVPETIVRPPSSTSRLDGTSFDASLKLTLRKTSDKKW